MLSRNQDGGQTRKIYLARMEAVLFGGGGMRLSVKQSKVQGGTFHRIMTRGKEEETDLTESSLGT